MNTFSRKLAAGVIALSIAFGPFLPAFAPKTHAITAFEINPALVGSAVTSAAMESTQTVIVQALNGLAWAVAKAAIRSMTQSIVNWINSGFDGSPAFATDLSRNLRQVADAHVGIFVRSLLANTSINSPYLDRVIGAVTRGYLLYTSRDLIAQRLEYTLANYVRNEAAFLRGDFQQGGFAGWMSSVYTCGNDPFCALLSTQEQLQREIAAEVDENVNDYLAGHGLFSWRCNCPEGVNEPGDGANLSDANERSACDICTPGSVLAHSNNEAINSAMEELRLADSINEIIGALAMQLVNEVIGPGGLIGTSRASTEGGRSYLEQIANESSSTGGSNLVAGLSQTFSSEMSRVQAYQDAWQRIQQVATQAAQACPSSTFAVDERNRSAQALTRGQSALSTLASLRTRLSTESTRTGGARTSVIQLLTNEYTCLVQGGTPNGTICTPAPSTPVRESDICPLLPSTLPTTQESSCILAQSASDEENTQTLYSRLKAIADNGCP